MIVSENVGRGLADYRNLKNLLFTEVIVAIIGGAAGYCNRVRWFNLVDLLRV